MPSREYGPLFLDRSHHREIVVASLDSAAGSRIGGRPPAVVAAAPPTCPLCSGPLLYVLTLGADALGPEIAAGRELSLLVCRSYECRMQSHALVKLSALVLVTHEASPRAAMASALDAETEPRALVLGPPTPDPVEDDWVMTDAAKLGGRPGYIQSWGPEEAAKAEATGAVFLCQWSENAYAIEGMEVGPYPFDGGVVYIFCEADRATGLPDLNAPQAFWQSS
jgi:hypothetical protein